MVDCLFNEKIDKKFNFLRTFISKLKRAGFHNEKSFAIYLPVH
jgi:hypothetical protein